MSAQSSVTRALEKPEKQTQCAVNLYKSSFPKKSCGERTFKQLIFNEKSDKCMLSFYSKIKLKDKNRKFFRTCANRSADLISKYICKFVRVWRDLMLHGIYKISSKTKQAKKHFGTKALFKTVLGLWEVNS